MNFGLKSWTLNSNVWLCPVLRTTIVPTFQARLQITEAGHSISLLVVVRPSVKSVATSAESCGSEPYSWSIFSSLLCDEHSEYRFDIIFALSYSVGWFEFSVWFLPLVFDPNCLLAIFLLVFDSKFVSSSSFLFWFSCLFGCPGLIMEVNLKKCDSFGNFFTKMCISQGFCKESVWCGFYLISMVIWSDHNAHIRCWRCAVDLRILILVILVIIALQRIGCLRWRICWNNVSKLLDVCHTCASAYLFYSPARDIFVQQCFAVILVRTKDLCVCALLSLLRANHVSAGACCNYSFFLIWKGTIGILLKRFLTPWAHHVKSFNYLLKETDSPTVSRISQTHRLWRESE